MIVAIVIGAVVLVVILGLVLSFNGLVRARNSCDNAWAQIEVQLKRRHDLIPNLVETVKGYAAHEKSTFQMVTEARANAINAGQSGSRAEQAQAENVLTGALKSLFAVAEAYPELKANQNFLALQSELSSTEDRVASSRQTYNESVLGYNTRIQTFPRNLVAGTFHFTAREFFEAEPEATAAVKVQF